jgi:teichuronic acid biosynthesis glycosyltransferase TuaC
MYPRVHSPQIGMFVELQVKALKPLVNGDINVISPVPWSPKCLWFKQTWREYGQTESTTVREGIRIYYPRYFTLPGNWFFPLQGFFIYLSIRRIVKKLAAKNSASTVLHTHTVLPDGLAGILLSRKFKSPHVCTIHGSDININPFINKLAFLLTRRTLERCDHIVSVSRKLRTKIQTISDAVNEISVIYNGADPAKFKPIPQPIAKKELGIEHRGKIIIFIGDLVPVKGADILIAAFAKLIKQDDANDACLFLIGDGFEKTKLAGLAKSLAVESRVCFYGKRNHEEIPLWLNAADVFVLPSISEGFPTVVPEVMMCGVPVVATDVGGVSEAVIDGTTGVLVKPREVESLAEAIGCCLKDGRFARKIAENGKHLSSKFTWLENARASVSIYNELLRTHSPRSLSEN